MTEKSYATRVYSDLIYVALKFMMKASLWTQNGVYEK